MVVQLQPNASANTSLKKVQSSQGTLNLVLSERSQQL